MINLRSECAEWRKSTYSFHNGECIEVAPNLPGVVGIRDSKNPTGPVLAVSPAAFRRLVRRSAET